MTKLKSIMEHIEKYAPLAMSEVKLKRKKKEKHVICIP
jgi:hypothetical protein